MSKLVRAAGRKPGMRFVPTAKLSSGQVTDKRHNSNFLYFLKNARQEEPLAASALRKRDYGVYYARKHGTAALKYIESHPPRRKRRVG